MMDVVCQKILEDISSWILFVRLHPTQEVLVVGDQCVWPFESIICKLSLNTLERLEVLENRVRHNYLAGWPEDRE